MFHFLQGYKKTDLFITTQMPMEDTVVDLWRMMYDYDCTSIVQLNAMDPTDKVRFLVIGFGWDGHWRVR